MSTIGLDVGTSRVKAVRFDGCWRAADVAAEPNDVRRLSDGRREQDMAAVWAAAARVLRTVAARSPEPVKLVAVTAQGDGCWLVDADGHPAGPALLWNDNRAAATVAEWQRAGLLDRAFAVNGCQGFPGLAHAQLVWLREHDPVVLERAARLLSCGSWVYAKLTGRMVLDVTDAANPFCDARTGEVAPELFEMFGIPELLALLPPIVHGTDRVAALAPGLATALGLAQDTLVALAPYDVPAAALGTGTTVPGSAVAVLGTTLCVGTVASDPVLDRPPTGMTLPAAVPGRWLIAYATMIGTELLDWLASLLGLADAAAVVALAATSTRADLPVILPYLSPAGERSPFLDPAVRGTITGLDVGHTAADLARAAVDGLSLVVRDCLQAAGGAGRLAVCGGGAASELWCRTLADATGLPVARPATAEVGALGAVISGAVDAGLCPDLDRAVAAAVRDAQEFAPSVDGVSRLAAQWDRFVEVRGAMR